MVSAHNVAKRERELSIVDIDLSTLSCHSREGGNPGVLPLLLRKIVGQRFLDSRLCGSDMEDYSSHKVCLLYKKERKLV